MITGAGGFIGRRLLDRLLADGWKVRAMLRSQARVSFPDDVQPVIVELPRLDGPACFSSVDAVVHLAARVHVMRDPSASPLAAFRAVNVDGTRALAQAARDAGVPRFIHASSIKVLGESSEGPLREDDMPRPVDPYGVSKLEAEEVVRDLYSGGGASILRFPLVYGPGMKGNMLSLFKLVDSGVPLPFGSVCNRRSMLFVDNAVEAIITLLSAPIREVTTFHLSDGTDLSTPELLQKIALALGRQVRLVAIPPRALTFAARVVDRFAGSPRSMQAEAAVQRLLGSLTIDSTNFSTVTGFKPPYSVDQGIAATANWYRNGAERLPIF